MTQLIAPVTTGPLAWYTAASGRQRVIASLQLPYGTPVIYTSLLALYEVSQQSASVIATPYGIAARYSSGAFLSLPWAQTLSSPVILPWSVSRKNTKTLSVPWQRCPSVSASLSTPWLSRSSVSASLFAPWWGDALDQASAVLRTPWSESTPAWRSLDAEPVLYWQGESIPVISASLSADEGSPYWLAQVRLAHRADYDRLPCGAAITLRLAGDDYHLVVDARTFSQSDSGEVDLSVHARSPICLADAPFAAQGLYHNDAPVSARDYVMELLAAVAPVDWQLLDWTIPAGRIAQDKAAPLSVATSIVSAVGGLIESLPHGHIVCRPRHAVRPCSSGFDLVITPGNGFSYSEALAPGAVFNSVIVSDGSDSSSGDVLEFTPSETNPLRGTVRAWPNPWRPVTLVHTSLGVSIGPREDRDEAQEEVLEILSGAAQTRYPAALVTGREWLHVDLGNAQVSGHNVTTPTPGYSLLRLNYTTRCWAWEVSHPDPAEVQFLLMDETP